MAPHMLSLFSKWPITGVCYIQCFTSNLKTVHSTYLVFSRYLNKYLFSFCIRYNIRDLGENINSRHIVVPLLYSVEIIEMIEQLFYTMFHAISGNTTGRIIFFIKNESSVRLRKLSNLLEVQLCN